MVTATIIKIELITNPVKVLDLMRIVESHCISIETSVHWSI